MEPGQIVRLEALNADQLLQAMDPAPDDAPGVVCCRSARTGPAASRVHGVTVLLDEIESAAIALFPRWLPDAARIAGPQGAGIAAVRAIAAEAAATSAHYGPFLAALAERALRAQRRSPRPTDPAAAGADSAGLTTPGRGFPAPVRAAGLARVIAASYRRPTAALLIELPAECSEQEERSLISAAAWIAYHGAWVVALITPASVMVAGSVSAAPGSTSRGQPADITVPADRTPSTPARTPLSAEGVPRPDSPAELALETALQAQPWAGGRVWNRTYQSHPLAPTYRLDLWWEAEHCVVEGDGPEHRSAEHYAADRRRDVQLQLDGQSVLRFTNDHVLGDVSDVVSQIERVIRSRRPQPAAFGESPTCRPTTQCPN